MDVGNNGGFNGAHKNKEKEGQTTHHATKFGTFEFGLRVLALLLSLTAAILLGFDKQTKTVPLQLSPDLPPFYVPVVSKYSYASAYVYFVVANSMACAFATLSLVVAFVNNTGGGHGKSVSRLMIIVADMAMVALLFSSVGAATAVGLIGLQGNSHLRWNKVCNVFGKFCHQVMVSVALSFLGAIAFFLLVLVSVSKLQKRN